uniref:(northern house mosquito) hypothetical protein n=1 Tax=Culex pipiens TaxID=7175 RepID=A0A8D8AVA6_CULPI
MIHRKDAKELQMPYQEAVPVRSKIRMQGPSYASFGWSRHSLSRWNHRGSTKENSASTRRFSSGLHLRRHRCFTRRRCGTSQEAVVVAGQPDEKKIQSFYTPSCS